MKWRCKGLCNYDKQECILIVDVERKPYQCPYGLHQLTKWEMMDKNNKGELQ